MFTAPSRRLGHLGARAVRGIPPLLCCLGGLLLIIPIIFIHIFRVACSLSGLPKPPVVVAGVIILINLFLDAIALAILEEVVWLGAHEIGLPRWESWLITRFLDLPVDLAISAGLHAVLMGIKFGKGIEVWFVQRLIQLTILVVITFIGVVVYLIQAN